MTQGCPGVYSRHYPHQTVVKCPNCRPRVEDPGTQCLGKRPPREPSRRVRYDRAQLIPDVFPRRQGRFLNLRDPSHRTLRDGFSGWRCPRYFVSGYDRTVPPGHFAIGFHPK
jgi:hypothetical protein